MEKKRQSSSHRSKIPSLMSVVERAISFASAIVIFSFLVSLVFRWCSLGSILAPKLSVGVSGGVRTSGVRAPFNN